MAYQSQANSQTQMTLMSVQQTPIYRDSPKTPNYPSEIIGNMGYSYAQQRIQSPIVDKMKDVLTPNISTRANTYQDTTNYSFTPVKVSATGIQGYTAPNKVEQGKEHLEEAERDKQISRWSSVGSTISDIYDANQAVKQAHRYTKDIIGTASQYEAQKKIIDANIAKQESLMTDAYTENMAQAETMYAGRNVDLSSEALTGVKQKGGIDLSSDITDIRERGELQKSALDLDYAMNVRKAAQNERYTVEQARNATTASIFNTALKFIF